MKKIIIAFCAVIWMSGCALQPQVSESKLYWGNYSHTLYEFKKNPSPDTRKQHIAEINDIILKSKELKLRVPPGVYAELGMYTMEDGHAKQAKQYFNMELQTYPESKTMVNQILKKKG